MSWYFSSYFSSFAGKKWAISSWKCIKFDTWVFYDNFNKRTLKNFFVKFVILKCSCVKFKLFSRRNVFFLFPSEVKRLINCFSIIFRFWTEAMPQWPALYSILQAEITTPPLPALLKTQSWLMSLRYQIPSHLMCFVSNFNFRWHWVNV